jgi:hypothetical protein
MWVRCSVPRQEMPNVQDPSLRISTRSWGTTSCREAAPLTPHAQPGTPAVGNHQLSRGGSTSLRMLVRPQCRWKKRMQRGGLSAWAAAAARSAARTRRVVFCRQRMAEVRQGLLNVKEPFETPVETRRVAFCRQRMAEVRQGLLNVKEPFETPVEHGAWPSADSGWRRCGKAC